MLNIGVRHKLQDSIPLDIRFAGFVLLYRSVDDLCPGNARDDEILKCGTVAVIAPDMSAHPVVSERKRDNFADGPAVVERTVFRFHRPALMHGTGQDRKRWRCGLSSRDVVLSHGSSAPTGSMPKPLARATMIRSGEASYRGEKRSERS